jgi:hypothetical protein
MVNGNFITSRLIPDLIKMSKEYKKKLEGTSVYRVTMIGKSFRDLEIKDTKDVWKNQINDDYKKYISRIERLSNNKLKAIQVHDIIPTVLYFEKGEPIKILNNF